MRKHKDEKLLKIDRKMGLRWKAARKKKKLTLENVAEILNKRGYRCFQSTINRVEMGKSQPDHFQVYIMLMCSVLDITPNLIFGDKEI